MICSFLELNIKVLERVAHKLLCLVIYLLRLPDKKSLHKRLIGLSCKSCYLGVISSERKSLCCYVFLKLRWMNWGWFMTAAWAWQLIFTLWNKSFNSEKIQPNLIPSKIIPIGWVDLNSKIKFAICHWTWEIGWIWHFLKKSGDKILAVSNSISVFSTRFELLLGSSEQ